jgi:hypothetical protein
MCKVGLSVAVRSHFKTPITRYNWVGVPTVMSQMSHEIGYRDRKKMMKMKKRNTNRSHNENLKGLLNGHFGSPHTKAKNSDLK